MEHEKYHALRRAAMRSVAEGDFSALAAMAEGGDQLYHSMDWSAWNDEQRLVFGILTGYKLSHHQNDNTAIQGADSLLQSAAGRLCLTILSEREVVLEIAKIVWEEIN